MIVFVLVKKYLCDPKKNVVGNLCLGCVGTVGCLGIGSLVNWLFNSRLVKSIIGM